MVSCAVAGLKLEGMLRVSELVHMLIVGAAALAGLEMLTRRVALAQWTKSCGLPDAFAKLASLPSGVAA